MTTTGDTAQYIRDLEDEVARLRQRVEELERAPRCCADTIPPGCRTCRCTDAAEAKLAKVVEIIEDMADTDPDDGTAWFHDRCCAALAAAKGE